MTNHTLSLWNLLTAAIPIVLALLAYFVRVEVILAKINRDLCWIKKILEGLQT